MKKILVLFLALITVLSVVACGGTASTTPVTTPKQDGGNTTTEPEFENIVFTENGKATLYIVVPEELTTGVNHGRQRLQIIVKEMVGATLLSGTMSDCEYELHLGRTDDTARAIYDELGEDKFAIKTVGKKIYIVAKDDLWLYDCVEYFAEKYLNNEEYVEAEGKSLAIKKAIDKVTTTDTESLRYYLSKGGTSLKGTVSVAATAVNSLSVQNPDGSKMPHRRQGGCFSGTAYYQGLITDGEEYGMIMMRDLTTGETKFSELIKSPGHINDMEYNCNTNEVLFSNGKKIYVFDGTTLELKKTITSPLTIGGHLAYDPIKDQYIASRFTFVNKDFTAATGKKFDEAEGYTNYNAKQGTSCDGYFVVALSAQSSSKGYNCHAHIYDMDGNFLGLIDISLPNNDEPENITILNNTLYVTGATTKPTATLYRVRIELP